MEYKSRKSQRIKAARISLPCCNLLEIGFPVVTDLDSGPPTLSVSQYKAAKGVPQGRKVGQRGAIYEQYNQELDVGFYSLEARTSINLVSLVFRVLR